MASEVIVDLLIEEGFVLRLRALCETSLCPQWRGEVWAVCKQFRPPGCARGGGLDKWEILVTFAED